MQPVVRNQAVLMLADPLSNELLGSDEILEERRGIAPVRRPGLLQILGRRIEDRVHAQEIDVSVNGQKETDDVAQQLLALGLPNFLVCPSFVCWIGGPV